ncbi:MAG: hypothetical protein ACE5F1_07240, partial [Planctomycetota bacterium]
MLSSSLACAVLSLLCVAPSFDEGYDLMILDAPHRAVLGDTLKFSVQGRPGNPYIVFADGARGRQLIGGRVWWHLAGSPVLFMPAFGFMPANGSAPHALALPRIASLDGVKLYMQSLCFDKGVFGGMASSDSKTLTLHKDLGQPLIRLLTVNRISRDLNASDPGEGIMTLPTVGFTIDLWFDERGKAAIDPSALKVVSDVDLAGGTIKANTNLARFFSFQGTTASGLVSASWAFPAFKTATIKATIKNKNGVISPQESLRFRIDRLTSANRPFATKQLWFLDFLAHDLDRSGVPDFREDLLLYGLGKSATAAAGPSFAVFEWTRKETQRVLRGHFGIGTKDAVNVDFLLTRPPTTHARICIGGRNGFPKSQLPPGAKETTGAAFLNPRNAQKNIIDCFGFVGVHPRSIYHLFRDVPAFKRVFDPLIANPVGNDPDDPIVTRTGFDPGKGTSRQRSRYQEIRAGVLALGKATAFILTQETCHSMGLVPTG